MHVAHQTEDLLVVEHCPRALGALLIAFAVTGPWLLFHRLNVEGALPTALGVFMIDFPVVVLFTVAVRRIVIVLDRNADRMALFERSVFRNRRMERPLDTLVRAERETNFTGIPFLPAHGHCHRAVLVVAEDRRLTRVPVTSVFLLGQSARRAAQAINGWLGRPLDSKGPSA